MGERKVLNFYVAPDFDATIIPRQKRDYTKLIEVRTMLPFSMRCNTCGEYMYRGKKFNSRKETMQGEEYMGIRKFRFYIKCSVCSAEITFCTDPKNSDYECESGALRNFEMWRENDAIVKEDEKQREEEDKVDAMKALENRTLDSKVEMDVLDALDEIQAINRRHERVDTNSVLGSLFDRSELAASQAKLSSGVTVADEALIKSIRFNRVVNKALPDSDEEVDEENDKAVSSKPHLSAVGEVQRAAAAAAAASSSSAAAALKPIIIRKRRENNASSGAKVGGDTTAKKQKTEAAPALIMAPALITGQNKELPVIPPSVERPTGLMGLMGYGSDDST